MKLAIVVETWDWENSSDAEQAADNMREWLRNLSDSEYQATANALAARRDGLEHNETLTDAVDYACDLFVESALSEYSEKPQCGHVLSLYAFPMK